jgi:hypothetical protein
MGPLALVIYTMTVSGYTTNTMSFPNIETCEAMKATLTETYDKLNETTNLGYSLSCEPTGQK